MAEISNDVYNSLSFKDITSIFSAHLKCPDGDCDKCILNEYKINGHRVGCLRLREIAMQRIVDLFGGKEVK